MRRIKVLLTTKLSNKKLEDKVKPIINLECISSVEVVRAFPGKPLSKIKYYSLPKRIRRNLFLEIFSLFILLPIRLIVNRPDLLIGIYYVPYGIFVQFLGKLFRIPCVCSLIGSDISLYGKIPTLWKIMKGSMQNCNILTTTGKKTKRLLVREGLDSSRIIVLPNPVDPIKYHPKKLKKQYDLISVSNLTPRKRIDLIIQSLSIVKKEFPKIKYIIVGTGPESERLEKLSIEYGLEANIEFLGERENICELLNKSQMYVLASANEGLAVSLMEAMASGLPVICTDVGDVRDIIKNQENGILIPPNNTEAIAEEILFLLKNPEKAKDIGKNALSVLQTNSPDASSDKWNEIFSLLDIV